MAERVRRWTPEELQKLRDDICDALEALSSLLDRIRFLLNEEPEPEQR
jgi:hypothetical protein